jgi:UDP-glucose 4-epimerase
MNVLVNGGAGYIGSHTVQALLAAGHKVFVYDNLSTGFREALPVGATFVQGDIRDSEKLAETMKTHGIQAVIHFAAKLIVPESLEQPVDYYDNNVNGVISLSRACQKAGVLKVIFSSTAAVYGESQAKGLITEDETPGPINPYGASKLMCERILKDCELGFGLKSVCLRYFNVAGAAVDGSNGQRTRNVTHLIQVSAQAALGKRERVDIFGTDFPTVDGSGVRDYIHVQDLADLHVLALKFLNEGGKTETFNCGYGAGFSVIQVIEAMRKVSGVNFTARPVGRRAGDPSSLVADSSRIKKAFEWTPKRNDLELICRTALDWERR